MNKDQLFSGKPIATKKKEEAAKLDYDVTALLASVDLIQAKKILEKFPRTPVRQLNGTVSNL